MKMKRALAVLFAVILVSASGLSAAEAKHVRPLELSPDSYDLNNGEFWFEAYAEDGAAGGSFTMVLYLEDRYSIAEVEALMPNDTVEVNGETYTVEAVVIHGEYDSDGDGELDTGEGRVRRLYCLHHRHRRILSSPCQRHDFPPAGRHREDNTAAA